MIDFDRLVIDIDGYKEIQIVLCLTNAKSKSQFPTDDAVDIVDCHCLIYKYVALRKHQMHDNILDTVIVLVWLT